MKNLLLFLDTSKSLSTMRLLSLSLSWTACLYIMSTFLVNEIIVLINIYLLIKVQTTTQIAPIVIDWYGAASFAGAGLIGKASQSFAENKVNQIKTSTTNTTVGQTSDVPVEEKVVDQQPG